MVDLAVGSQTYMLITPLDSPGYTDPKLAKVLITPEKLEFINLPSLITPKEITKQPGLAELLR